MKVILHRFSVGFSRNPKRFFSELFFGYTGIWALLEVPFSICSYQPSHKDLFFLAYGVVSIFFAVIRSYPKHKVSFRLSNTNTEVTIHFGDIFQTKGVRVIPVSQYFDTEIGQPVSPMSLHGKLIADVFGNHVESMNAAIDKQLGPSSVQVVRRYGKNSQYPIGSTVVIDFSENKYFLFALSQTDEHCKAECNPSMMLSALKGLWDRVLVSGNGVDVNIPLVGSGRSSVGLPPTQLVELILISLLHYTKQRELACKVNIILMYTTFDDIDLSLIENNWN